MNDFMNRIFLILIFLLIQNTESYCQNWITKYTLLENTDGDFKTLKKDASADEIKNEFYLKNRYKDSLLISVSLYDKKGELFDDLYLNAITEYEYENKIVKYKRLYDKNHQRTEDNFKGYWSIEYIFDKEKKLKKEKYTDKSGNPVQFYPNIDNVPPIIEYEYLENACFEKWIDNENNIVNSDTCDCPKIKIKLIEY